VPQAKEKPGRGRMGRTDRACGPVPPQRENDGPYIAV
jgi:hypothetical protein